MIPEEVQNSICREFFLDLYFLFDFNFFGFLGHTTQGIYGGSQARDRIRATAAGRHHSHSNTGSKARLRPNHRSWQCRILNPPSKARDPTCVLVDTTQIPFHCATTGTPF